MPARRPGRPNRPAIDRDRVLDAALRLLEREGLAAVTMRALARGLGVDPMALYHYFEDRDALLAEAAARTYRTLASKPVPRGAWRVALQELASDYVELLARSGELLRYLTARAAASRIPKALFAERFHAVTAALKLTPRIRRAAHDAFVDFVHGFSLGTPRTGLTPALRKQLRGELALLFAGIAAYARR